MEDLIYMWEVIKSSWLVILTMALVSIPILWLLLEDNSEFEDLKDYYNTKDKQDLDK